MSVTLEHYPTKFKAKIRHCIKLLKTKEKNLSYCLIYKEWIDHCPPKCGYFEEGNAGSIEEIKKRKLNYECLYFSRKHDEQDYFCKLFEQMSPFCDSCQYPAYKD